MGRTGIEPVLPIPGHLLWDLWWKMWQHLRVFFGRNILNNFSFFFPKPNLLPCCRLLYIEISWRRMSLIRSILKRSCKLCSYVSSFTCGLRCKLRSTIAEPYEGSSVDEELSSAIHLISSHIFFPFANTLRLNVVYKSSNLMQSLDY